MNRLTTWTRLTQTIYRHVADPDTANAIVVRLQHSEIQKRLRADQVELLTEAFELALTSPRARKE